MIALLLAMSTVQAGWWSDFCERHLIAEDPYQYESAPEDWLKREIAQLEIKEAWGKLSRQEGRYLAILRGEIRRRESSK